MCGMGISCHVMGVAPCQSFPFSPSIFESAYCGGGAPGFPWGNAINPEETEAILIVTSTLQIVDTLFNAGPSLLPSQFRASLSRGGGHQTSQGHWKVPGPRVHEVPEEAEKIKSNGGGFTREGRADGEFLCMERRKKGSLGLVCEWLTFMLRTFHS